MRALVVHRDPEDLGAEAPDSEVRIAKRARLGRAARRHVLRVEVEDDIALPGELGERDLLSAPGRELELGSSVPRARPR